MSVRQTGMLRFQTNPVSVWTYERYASMRLCMKMRMAMSGLCYIEKRGF